MNQLYKVNLSEKEYRLLRCALVSYSIEKKEELENKNLSEFGRKFNLKVIERCSDLRKKIVPLEKIL